MRLVDADESGWYVDKRGCEMMEEMPTIDAIPVEWLLNHIPKDEVMQRYNEKLIEYLVIGWREENESNTCD